MIRDPQEFYRKLGNYVVLTLSVVVVLSFLYILSPLFYIICWAGIIAFFIYPVYRWLNLRIKHKRISSLCVILILVLLVIGPLLGISVTFYSQVISILEALRPIFEKTPHEFIEGFKRYPRIYELLLRLLEIFNPYLPQVQERVAQFLTHLIQAGFFSITNIFRFFFSFGFQLAFTLITLYYFLVDGERVVNEIKNLIPGGEGQKQRILEKVAFILKGVLYGNVLTALVQGTLAFMIYFILGIPHNLLWAFLTMLASFLPMLGTFLVWGPLTLYLVIKGAYAKALILLLFSALIISNVDNFLKPVLIGGKTKIHNLLIFFSVIGGIVKFGVLGLFLGPFILALFLCVIEIYKIYLLYPSDINRSLEERES